MQWTKCFERGRVHRENLLHFHCDWHDLRTMTKMMMMMMKMKKMKMKMKKMMMMMMMMMMTAHEYRVAAPGSPLLPLRGGL
jgi:hypothetical protein